MKSDSCRVKLFVYLLEEGTDVWRPTEAVRCETRQVDSGSVYRRGETINAIEM
jgi:hypothetical protein